jgi:hypothetical protein
VVILYDVSNLIRLHPADGGFALSGDCSTARVKGLAPMTDIAKARKLFHDSGLTFPTIPEELAVHLREQDEWLYSTREIAISPYELHHYVKEVGDTCMRNYVVLSHAGHGVNSYALQYYLVYGRLAMFLHLGWGGAYMDGQKTAAQIRDCFSLADQIAAIPQRVDGGEKARRLKIVGSDFYGSYWCAPAQKDLQENEDAKRPADVLTQALHWLKDR